MHPFQMKFAIYVWFINALAYPVIFFYFVYFFSILTFSKRLVLKVQILVNFSYESFFANSFLIQFAVLCAFRLHK